MMPEPLTPDQIVEALKKQADAVGKVLRKFPGMAIVMRAKLQDGLILVCGTDIAVEGAEE